MKLIIVFTFLVSLNSCIKEDILEITSLSSVLSDQEKQIGRKVVVVGFMGRGEDVFLTRDHADIDDISSSIAIYITALKRERLRTSICKNNYVEIAGQLGLVKYDGVTPRFGITDVYWIHEQKNKSVCYTNNE